MSYQIRYQDEVVAKHIPALPQAMKTMIKRAIEERLMIDPVGFGKPLRYSLKGHRRLRVGDYRVVYRIDADTQTVIIVAIKHRKDVYESPREIVARDESLLRTNSSFKHAYLLSSLVKNRCNRRYR